MRKALYLYIIYAAISLLAACHGSGGGDADRTPQPGDTLYTGAHAMEVYAREPERALVIIDSAQLVGNLPDYRADLLRARVYAQSMEMLQLDTAQILCEALLRHDSVEASTTLQIEVIDQLIGICRLRQDYEQWLQWATEKAELCRKQALVLPTELQRSQAETEALRNEADIGVILTHLGQTDEGLARLDYTIARLDHPGSVNHLDALVIALKRKINVLLRLDRYADVVPVVHQLLDRLNRFAEHPADYAEDSGRLPLNATDRACYIDFYRAQAHIFLAKAYVELDQRQQAWEQVALYEQSDFSQTYSGRRQIASVWKALGEYDKALASYDEQEQHLKGDTICDDYALILLGRADIAQAQGHLAASIDYHRRYEALTSVLHERLLESKAHERAIRYQLQEQRMEAERMEARAQRSRLIAIGIGIVLLLCLSALVWFWWQQRVISRKNRSLVKQISETLNYKKMYEELRTGVERAQPAAPSPEHPKPAAEEALVSLDSLSHDQLFDRIHNLIKREKLYLDPNFDRQSVIDYLHLPKERIGQAFAQGSDYSSISDFIRDCRLEHACELLGTTDMPIGEIATASGFSRVTTFNHDFKQKFNVAPSIYRQQLRK